MFSRFSTENLARVSASRPKRTILIWAAALFTAMFLILALFKDATTTEFTFFSNPESEKANQLIEDRLRGPQGVNDVVIVRFTDQTVESRAAEAYVVSLHEAIMGLGSEIVAGGITYYQTGDETLVFSQRNSTLIPLVMAGEFKQAEANIGKVRHAIEAVPAPEGAEVFMTGTASFSRDYTEFTQKDLEKGEALAMPFAMLILAAVFGTLAAAVLPMVLAVGAIVIAVGIVALVGQVFEMHVFVQNMITMIGLAVGIDYSLFVLSRYREERAKGLSILDAITTAGATAGRAVVFSGLTVVLALVGLLIVPHSVWISLGIGAILVVSIAVVASLTLLPAVLSLMADRVERFRLPFIGRKSDAAEAKEGGMWDRVTRSVMRRPLMALVVTAGLLIAAAVPYVGIETGIFGVSTFPDSSEAKQGFMVLDQEFGAGLNDPAEIVIDGDINLNSVQSGMSRLTALLDSNPMFGPSRVETNDSGDLAVITVALAGDATGSEETVTASRTLRDEYVPQAFSGVPAQVLVTGTTAEEIDFIDLTSDYQLPVIALVLGLSFILLTLVFRSIVIPAKAMIMNLLSVGAAYGLLVLVFQKGIGNELFGFEQVEVIQQWIPLMLFAVLFGLSVDYQVFLLSRIRERYLQTGNNDEAVAHGLRSTAGLITGAALIMVAVFAGFATGDLVAFQQFEFAMAVAVPLDATIVRTILVPATMKLLGDANWYMPKMLRWLPEIQVEGQARPIAVPITSDAD